MQVDLTTGSNIAVMGVAIAAISSLVGQWLTIKKVSAEARDRREDAKIALDASKAEAELLRVKMEAAAKLVEHRVAENAREVSRVAAHAAVETKELKAMVKENSVITEDGTMAAKNAYHEANQVNIWRGEVQKEIRELASAVKALAEMQAGKGSPLKAPEEVVDTRVVEVSKQAAREIKAAVAPPGKV